MTNLRKSKLARLYFPELPPHQACNRLRRWIMRCLPLQEELRKTNYSPTQRLLTPRQRSLITHYLGEP